MEQTRRLIIHQVKTRQNISIEYVTGPKLFPEAVKLVAYPLRSSTGTGQVDPENDKLKLKIGVKS